MSNLTDFLSKKSDNYHKHVLNFLKNLDIIDHTSDVFIHFKLPLLDPSIQQFNFEPAVAYQLSNCQNPKFYSEIHPRGIDEYDRQRLSRHVQRKEYVNK